jgi:hypothetical protein
MRDSLHYINISFTGNSIESNEWMKIITQKSPAPGLFSYGMTITEKGIIVIQGGFTNTTTLGIEGLEFVTHSELWYFDLHGEVKNFGLIRWDDSAQGFSKLIYLGNEIICVLHKNTPMKCLDINQHKIISPTGFSFKDLSQFHLAVSQLNSNEFVIFEGQSLKVVNINRILLIYNGNNTVYMYDTDLQLYAFFILLPVLVGVLVIIKLKSKKLNTSKNSYIQKKNCVNWINENMEISKTVLTTEASELHNAYVQTLTKCEPQETVTLQNTCDAGIYIPGYKKFRIGYDFTLRNKLAEGGFGAVFLGELINDDLRNQHNNGKSECVIKLASKSVITPMFLQELSIHEVFKKEKYFAQLICYSEEPQTIVLKYYRYGTLAAFVFPSKKKPLLSSKFEYSLKTILFIAEKLAFGYNHMHSRRMICNDIKLDNILLDGDEEEPIHPIITDFGICKIMDSADVVNGFEVKEIRAFTSYYSAPEVLYSIVMKDKKRKSNFKTDVYSLGVILAELFTRKKMWEKFDAAHVISGGSPDLTTEWISKQWREITEEMVLNMFCLVMDCIEYDCTKRPSMQDIYENLSRLSSL